MPRRKATGEAGQALLKSLGVCLTGAINYLAEAREELGFSRKDLWRTLLLNVIDPLHIHERPTGF